MMIGLSCRLNQSHELRKCLARFSHRIAKTPLVQAAGTAAALKRNPYHVTNICILMVKKKRKIV